MAQNIYDDETFFAGYSNLPRSQGGLDAMPEWPAMRAMLPDLAGLRVLDLGCGFGWFCRWARERGAARVLGVDLSENMLARARAATGDPLIAYLRADLERLELPPAAFDLAYSALALHYVEDLGGLIARVALALAPAGHLVFSVEHPLFTAPAEPDWLVDPAGRTVWPLDRYLDEGPRRTCWLADGVVKQHRTIATYVNLLLAQGFAIRRIDEWGPGRRQIEERPDWARERDRPPFLLISASAACGRRDL
jgi:SAM-dependent methyltransferase